MEIPQTPKSPTPTPPVNKQWHVYLLECKDGSFYTGTTNDIDKRMKSHVDGTGSKYVRHKKFKKLLATKKCTDRSDACKAEHEIRKLSKYEKIDWFKPQTQLH